MLVGASNKMLENKGVIRDDLVFFLKELVLQFYYKVLYFL